MFDCWSWMNFFEVAKVLNCGSGCSSRSSLVSLLTDSSLHGVKKLAPPTSCCCVINSLVGIILLQGIAHSSFLNRWGWTNLSCDYCSYTAWFWRHDLAKASDIFHFRWNIFSGNISGFSQYLPLFVLLLVWLPSEERVLLWLSLNTNLPVDKPLGAQLQVFGKLLVKCSYFDSLCLPHCF